MIFLGFIKALGTVPPRFHLDKLSSPRVHKNTVGNVLTGQAQRVTAGWHWSLLGFQGSLLTPVPFDIFVSMDTAL